MGVRQQTMEKVKTQAMERDHVWGEPLEQLATLGSTVNACSFIGITDTKGIKSCWKLLCTIQLRGVNNDFHPVFQDQLLS